MNYRLSPQANADIEEICAHIAEDNLDAASRMNARIHQSISTITEFPAVGHTRNDVKDSRYHFWAIGNYVVAYRVEPDLLIVIRVLHGARDFRKIFKQKQ